MSLGSGQRSPVFEFQDVSPDRRLGGVSRQFLVQVMGIRGVKYSGKPVSRAGGFRVEGLGIEFGLEVPCESAKSRMEQEVQPCS